jgi:hypothetical protein
VPKELSETRSLHGFSTAEGVPVLIGPHNGPQNATQNGPQNGRGIYAASCM